MSRFHDLSPASHLEQHNADQGTQAVEPALLKLPGAQPSQASSDSAPRAVPNVPAGHLINTLSSTDLAFPFDTDFEPTLHSRLLLACDTWSTFLGSVDNLQSPLIEFLTVCRQGAGCSSLATRRPVVRKSGRPACSGDQMRYMGFGEFRSMFEVQYPIVKRSLPESVTCTQ